MSLSNRLRLSVDQWIILAIAAATAALRLAVAGRYDLMRNELYFLACGRHPAFGYADQPPLVPLIAAATQMFGESVWLMRLPAVIAATALVPVTAALARTLGGGRAGAIVAAVAAATALGTAAVTTTLTTATFEPIAWALVAWLMARAILLGDRRAPIWAGLVAGLALEAKYGIILWLVPMTLGLAATAAGRALLARRETRIGVAIATVIAAPSLIWQALNGWPFLEIIANHTPGNFTGGALRFALGQITAMNLLLAPLWIAGAIAPFVVDRLKPVRFLAIAFMGAAALTWLTHGKDYYLFGAYPAMFAIGAVVVARLWRWAIGLWLAACVANFMLIAPVLFPLLPPWRLFGLLEHSHLRPAPDEKAAIGAPLTQIFSEEMGWRELEGQAANVYRALPPADLARAAILARNYGEAAAIDIYGPKDGLPPAISGDNQYWLWGPRGYDGSVIIHINGNPDDWRSRCGSVTLAGRFGVPLAMPFERDRPIFVCRDLKGGLAAAWPGLKRYGQ
ncbi:glycosyltransferase family 39 protein [Sphingomonas sp. MMS24-J13]|uniref:glycosyltransferase family 39 protein n=1 Tax=Sphingomonas sp. MMS24-J13 TaxID=3238686 RepID=UPI0038502D9B